MTLADDIHILMFKVRTNRSINIKKIKQEVFVRSEVQPAWKS